MEILSPHPVALRALEHFDALFPDEAESRFNRNVFTLQDGDSTSLERCLPRGGEELLNDLGLGEHVGRYREVSEKKASGVTYTPRLLADFVADQLVSVAKLETGKPTRILDPAIGHGELLQSLLARISGDVEVFGFETDADAIAVATARLSRDYPHARLNFVEGSFLDHVIDDFSEGLFPQGQKYDLIIANPPYVRTQIIGAERAQDLASQFQLTGRVDLYFAFLLGMARVLSPSGSAGMIVSNRFMTTRAGGSIREALLRNLRLRSIFDLGDTKLFDAAVLPAVIIANGGDDFERTTPVHFTTIYESKASNFSEIAEDPIAALQRSGVVGLSDGRTFEVNHGTLHNDAEPSGVWRLSSEGVSAWLDVVDANTWARFRDLGKVRVGVKTCADKVFIKNKWPDALELLRPLTTHKIARRFRADATAHSTQILYPHEVVEGRRAAVDLSLYPASRAYLEAHRGTLEGRGYVIEGGRNWYEIWVPQNPENWCGPKLVFRDICEQPTFWIDLDDTIVNGDCYWLKPKPEMGEVLWLALAVANSSFIEKFYDRRFNNKLYAGRRRFITQYVDEFPLPDPTTLLSHEIIGRAKALYERVAESGAASLEAELDGLVWQSFGLSVEKV